VDNVDKPMTFPSRRPDVDYDHAEPRTPEWENACFVYLRFCLDRMPPNAIRAAANQVYKHMPMVGLTRRETVH
jgi:hypothetical protein